MRHVMLVGATDGMGLALAREYLAEGWRVALVGRDETKLERARERLDGAGAGVLVPPVRCDVSRPEAIEPAFRAALEALGQMELLVYCAGVMPPAATLEERLAGAGPMLDVNVLGAVHFLERGAAYLEPLGRGRLAAIGSVAGERGRRGNPVYCASKAALHAYLEGLRHRLRPKGVGVSTVKPGFVRTRMLGPDTRSFPPAISAESAARRIRRALERGRDEFFVPGWWAPVGAGLRHMPGVLYKRLAPP